MSTSPTSPVSPFPSPTEQRSKAPEFYGFVAWTSTYILFVLYILWALLPDEYIQWTGVTWYPSRYVHFNHSTGKAECVIEVNGRFFFQHTP